MLKIYINRDVDVERRERMERDWPGFERLPACDGWLWADGVSDYGVPIWKPEHRGRAYSINLHIDSELSPAEYACSLSHMDAWYHFLSTDHETAVILEDDVRPCHGGIDLDRALWGLNITPIRYLFSPNHPGDRIGLQRDGRVRWCRSHMGVMMTRAGAEAAIKAMTPIYRMHDSQVGERICSTWTKPRSMPADMPELPKIDMYGLWDGLVEHNELAKRSTLTRDGTKSWIAERCRV